MGSIYANKVWGLKNPRVALLSNGTEETKGTSIVKKAHQILKKLPLNFIGNIEGNNLVDNSCDVAVCEGFSGNIALKTVEGAGNLTFR